VLVFGHVDMLVLAQLHEILGVVHGRISRSLACRGPTLIQLFCILFPGLELKHIQEPLRLRLILVFRLACGVRHLSSRFLELDN
jgi:hypothetical protein